MPACLILERHPWETGFQEEQVQIPAEAFREFFGEAGEVNIRVFGVRAADRPTRTLTALLSQYGRSHTYRINRIDELGDLPQCFLFVQRRAGAEPRYDLWWDTDVAGIVNRFHPWRQARGSQYRRGRLWQIVPQGVRRRG